jgi:hypothetical protein
VRRERPADVTRGDSVVRHPIHAAVHEAAHLREIANEGESTATPAILIAAVLAFVVPLVAGVITLADLVAHFS